MQIRSAPYQPDNLFLCCIKPVDSYSTTSWSSRISAAFNCPSSFISTYTQLSGHLMPRTYCSSITRSPRFTWPSPLTSPFSTQVGSTTAPLRHRGGNALPAGQSSWGGRTAQPDNAKRNNNTHPVIFIFRSSIGGSNCMAVVFHLPVAMRHINILQRRSESSSIHQQRAWCNVAAPSNFTLAIWTRGRGCSRGRRNRWLCTS